MPTAVIFGSVASDLQLIEYQPDPGVRLAGAGLFGMTPRCRAAVRSALTRRMTLLSRQSTSRPGW
jgi:hypothetical protein